VWKPKRKRGEGKKMHFIFGYSREIPVKIEREVSKLALVGLAILIVFLFIFLTFEDLDEEIRPFQLTSRATSDSTQLIGLNNQFELDSGNPSNQTFSEYEPKNFSHSQWDLESK
jgi:hypothetical protein